MKSLIFGAKSWTAVGLSLAAVLTGCGGRGTSTSSSSSGAPGTLTYTSSSVAYYVNTLITPDTASTDKDVSSYTVSPALPTGLTLNSSNGTISGTPTVLQNPATYTVAATNAYGTDTVNLTIAVVVPPPAITYTGSPFTYYKTVAITPLSPNSTWGPITSCSVSPALPAGLILSSGCVVSGTPTAITPAANYVITATNSTGSGSATINIQVYDLPTQLVFSTEPSSSADAGATLATQPVLEAEDASGILVTTATNSITLKAYTNSTCTTLASGTLSATTNPLAAASGYASFAGVGYDGIEGTFYLGASSSGLTSACSSAISVTAGTATKLAFSTEPSSSGQAGVVLGAQPVVQVQDAYGDLVTTATNSVTLAAYTNSTCSTPASGTFSATTNPLAASSGSASFAGVKYSGVEGTIYVGASTGGLTSACSTAITITAGTATKLAFSTEPSSSGQAGVVLGAQPVVQVQDAYGDLVTTATNSITLAAYTNSTCSTPASGTFSATTNPLAASSGSASFAGVKYGGVAGTVYLGASTGGLTSACSTAITITAGTAAQLAFSTQPSSSAGAGVNLGTQPVVQIQDAYGNATGSGSNLVTLASYSDSVCSTSAGGTLSATTNPLTASAGSAGFVGVNYGGLVGTIYLGASTPGLTSACSNAIGITPGPAALLAFTTEPPFDALTGMSFIDQPVVQIQDVYTNPTGSGTNSIALAAYTDSACSIAASGTLSGNTLSASSGVATYTAVTYTGSAGVIYIGASTSGLTSSCTSAVNMISNQLSPIAGGNDEGLHTCAASTAGNVYCWGDNNDGQLGNNSTTAEETPVEVLGVGGSGDLSGIAGVTAGEYHSCALSSSGNVYCWGYNRYGQLGNNSTTTEKEPVEVLGVGGSGDLSGIVSMAAGQYHTCALSSSGNVYCWGYNTDGQLGNNSTTTEKEPVEVLGVGGSGDLSGIVSIAAGEYHTCALSSGGNVYCWGDNQDGQLGNDSTTTEREPVEVRGVGGSGDLSGIVGIVGGRDHTCALGSGGTVYCWGDNQDGQLGNGSENTEEVPVEVEGVGGSGNLSGIVNLAAGEYHSCALSSAGSVYCWGDNQDGQLGNGSENTEEVPVEVEGVGGTGDLSGITGITAGELHSCALSSAGNVYCWGDNGDGQIGNDSTTTEETPVEVLGVGGSGDLSGI